MYIRLGNDKRPLHSLDITYDLEAIANEENYGMMVPEPYVVIDVDDNDDFIRLFKLIRDENVQTRVLKTDNGGHFWFKSLEPLTNHVNINTPLTIPIDIRSYGKKSYVVMKKDGKERKWMQYNDEVDELPYWLKPIKLSKDLRGMEDGDGRNNGLFTYIIPLLHEKFNKEEIHKIFDLINKWIFKDPLKSTEIEVMFSHKVFEETEALFFDGNRFMHNELAKWIQASHFVKKYAGELWVYKDGVYEADSSFIETRMVEQIPRLTRHQRRETMAYLELTSDLENELQRPTTINVMNGLLNVDTQTLSPHTAAVFSISQLPVHYNPEAYNAAVDSVLDKVTRGNKDLRGLVEEMIGYTLYGDNKFQKAFILVGGGSNGKSSFMQMLSNMLGVENIATLTMDEFEQRFKPPELVGKLANLGDDIPRELVRDSSIFKRLVTGDPVTVERKGMDPFTFHNKAKIIFTANELPPTTDKTRGFMRRMVVVPFTAEFSTSDKDYDPYINDKITTDNAASYLLNLAIKGLGRLLKRNAFPEVEAVQAMQREYEISVNSVLDWMVNGNADIENRVSKDVYADYNLFCTTVGAHPYSVNRFNREIRERKKLDLSREWIDGGTYQVWRDKKYIEGMKQ